MFQQVAFQWQTFRNRLRDRKNLPAYLRKLLGKLFFTLCKYLLVVSVAFVFVYPFLYMVITAVKSPQDLADPTVGWIPTQIWKDNFTIAFHALKYTEGLKNSAIVTILSTIGHLFSAALAGYGMARYRFKGRSFLLIVLVLTIIVPPQVTVIPSYITFSKLGLLKTYLPIILPTFFGAGIRGGLFIFIFRQFYTGIPTELEEAARVDGCGPFATFMRIILPNSKSPILVTAILSIVWHWTDSYESVMFIQDPNKKVVIARLPDLFSVLNKPSTETVADIQNKLIYNEAVVMCATFLVVLPILFVYLIMQRQFMQGIERSGIVG